MAESLQPSLRQYKQVFFVVLLFLFSACGGEPAHNPISGGVDAEILNLQDSAIHIYSQVSPINIMRGLDPKFDTTLAVDSNGIFILPYPFTEGYYYFEYQNNPIKYFIQEGKKLSLDFDATKPTETPNFSGKMKYESRYLFDKHMTIAKFLAQEDTYFALSEDTFLTEINKLRVFLDKALLLYITNRPTGSEYFMKQESLSNLYLIASLIEKYKIRHRELVPGVTISDTFIVLTNNLNINDVNAKENPEFYDFVQWKIWALSGRPNQAARVYTIMQLSDSLLNFRPYSDYVRFQTAREVAKWTSNKAQEQVLDTLINSITDVAIRYHLTQIIQIDTATFVPDSTQLTVL